VPTRPVHYWIIGLSATGFAAQGQVAAEVNRLFAAFLQKSLKKLDVLAIG